MHSQEECMSLGWRLLLYLILYEVPHCDFNHTNGDLMLCIWSFWIEYEVSIFMESILFMALNHFMEIFSWASLNSAWLDGDFTCWLVVFSHMLTLLVAPQLHFWWMWSILSHYGGLVYIYAYI